MSIFENAAAVCGPRNKRVSAKFRAAHKYISEFSNENSILNETRYFSVSFKRFVFHDGTEHKVVGKGEFVDGFMGIFHGDILSC